VSEDGGRISLKLESNGLNQNNIVISFAYDNGTAEGICGSFYLYHIIPSQLVYGMSLGYHKACMYKLTDCTCILVSNSFSLYDLILIIVLFQI